MEDKLCLQWNDFKENLGSSFGDLRGDKDLTDVTLACEDGKQVEAHKVILAASSPFFQEILKKNKHPHPLIYMRGVRTEDLVAVLDFLYCGETDVSEENLDTFLAIAQELKLKGLMEKEGIFENDDTIYCSYRQGISNNFFYHVCNTCTYQYVSFPETKL